VIRTEVADVMLLLCVDAKMALTDKSFIMMQNSVCTNYTRQMSVHSSLEHELIKYLILLNSPTKTISEWSLIIAMSKWMKQAYSD